MKPNNDIVAPPDAVSRQLANRRLQKYTEELKALEEMDQRLALLTRHRNGHAARIRMYARENGFECDENKLLTHRQLALKLIDFGLRALSIDPTIYPDPATLKQALIEHAGYNEEHPIVSSSGAIYRAWALLVAAETE